MRVLKITAEGLTTSFRYPHFMIGVQPTYEMPPPATLYGHIASALGYWFDPRGVRFAVRFTYRAKQTDIETTYFLKAVGGKMPNAKNHPKVLEGNPNPLKRELLFFPRMVLYLDRPDWLEAFRHPHYTVVLGRSQDLFTYRAVEIVELHPTERAYLEHTLLPYDYAKRTAAGQSVLMPAWLDHQRRRFPTFERYVVLHRRVHSRDLLRWPDDPGPELWADPTEPEIQGDPLGLAFLTWPASSR
jgi:CRISPR-associated protein Cas5t